MQIALLQRSPSSQEVNGLIWSKGNNSEKSLNIRVCKQTAFKTPFIINVRSIRLEYFGKEWQNEQFHTYQKQYLIRAIFRQKGFNVHLCDTLYDARYRVIMDS